MSKSSGPGPSSPHDAARERMVARHLRARGIRDARVLEAMARVPRELFVPDHLADDAYADSPLPIGHGQTISQPFIVALTAEAARISPGDRVLDVGTGSGYAAAVYAAMGARVWSVEYVPELAEAARAALDAASAAHVRRRRRLARAAGACALRRDPLRRRGLRHPAALASAARGRRAHRHAAGAPCGLAAARARHAPRRPRGAGRSGPRALRAAARRAREGLSPRMSAARGRMGG